MNVRLVVALTAVLAVATPTWHGIWSVWSWLVVGREYSRPFEWLDPPTLLLWALNFVVCAGLGFLVVAFARPARPLAIGAAVGLLFELSHRLFTRDYLAADLLYGLYVVAPLGSLTGAAAGNRVTLRLLSNNRWSAP
jgi:hypothetical protein